MRVQATFQKISPERLKSSASRIDESAQSFITQSRRVVLLGELSDAGRHCCIGAGSDVITSGLAVGHGLLGVEVVRGVGVALCCHLQTSPITRVARCQHHLAEHRRPGARARPPRSSGAADLVLSSTVGELGARARSSRSPAPRCSTADLVLSPTVGELSGEGATAVSYELELALGRSDLAEWRQFHGAAPYRLTIDDWPPGDGLTAEMTRQASTAGVWFMAALLVASLAMGVVLPSRASAARRLVGGDHLNGPHLMITRATSAGSRVPWSHRNSAFGPSERMRDRRCETYRSRASQTRSLKGHVPRLAGAGQHDVQEDASPEMQIVPVVVPMIASVARPNTTSDRDPPSAFSATAEPITIATAPTRSHCEIAARHAARTARAARAMPAPLPRAGRRSRAKRHYA